MRSFSLFHHKQVDVFVLAGFLVASCGAGFAQEIINNQDEVVNITASDFVSPKESEQKGSVQDSSGILTIYRTEDKTQVQNYITKLVPLEFAPAQEVVDRAAISVEPEGGTLTAWQYTDPKTKEVSQSVMVVTTEAQMPYIEELIMGFDRPGMLSSSGTVNYGLRIQNRLASDVVDVMRITTGAVDLLADDLTNTLYFEDRLSEISADLNIIEFFDVPPLQIQFDIQIIQIVKSDAKKLGLDWDAWKNSLGGEVQLGGNRISGASDTRLDWLFTLDATTLAEFLNYTVQSGTSSIKKRAKVSANNLTPAIISNVTEVNIYDYVEVTEDNTIHVTKDPNDQDIIDISPQRSKFRKQVVKQDQEGIAITILPVIAANLVTAQIGISSRTISKYDKQGNPVFTSQEYESTVTLQDNRPLHIGTLEGKDQIEQSSGIPGLKDLPVLKYIFGYQASQDVDAQLFIIATPKYSEAITYPVHEMKGKSIEGDVLRINAQNIPSFVSREMLNMEGLMPGVEVNIIDHHSSESSE